MLNIWNLVPRSFTNRCMTERQPTGCPEEQTRSLVVWNKMTVRAILQWREQQPGHIGVIEVDIGSLHQQQQCWWSAAASDWDCGEVNAHIHFSWFAMILFAHFVVTSINSVQPEFLKHAFPTVSTGAYISITLNVEDRLGLLTILIFNVPSLPPSWTHLPSMTNSIPASVWGYTNNTFM